MICLSQSINQSIPLYLREIEKAYSNRYTDEYGKRIDCFYVTAKALGIEKNEFTHRLGNIRRKNLKQVGTIGDVFIIHHKRTVYHAGLVIGQTNEGESVLWSKLGANEFSIDTVDSIMEKYSFLNRRFHTIKISYVSQEYFASS